MHLARPQVDGAFPRLFAGRGVTRLELGELAPRACAAIIRALRPGETSDEEVEQTIADFVNCAALAQYAAYDGVEIMGSEGYLINEFIAARTNHRSDRWGGAYENRIRFAVEIVRRVRERVGTNFIVIYRLSMLDLVEGGSTLDEVIRLGFADSEIRTCRIATGEPELNLRRLRRTFEVTIGQVVGAIETTFPHGTRVTRPRGGYLLWVELPRGLSSRELFERALAQGICFVPGDIFSASGRYGNCLRLSCGHAWDPATEQAVAKLGKLANAALIGEPERAEPGPPPHAASYPRTEQAAICVDSVLPD